MTQYFSYHTGNGVFYVEAGRLVQVVAPPEDDKVWQQNKSGWLNTGDLDDGWLGAYFKKIEFSPHPNESAKIPRNEHLL